MAALAVAAIEAGHGYCQGPLEATSMSAPSPSLPTPAAAEAAVHDDDPFYWSHPSAPLPLPPPTMQHAVGHLAS